jgi:hypothetical protein
MHPLRISIDRDMHDMGERALNRLLDRMGEIHRMSGNFRLGSTHSTGRGPLGHLSMRLQVDMEIAFMIYAPGRGSIGPKGGHLCAAPSR